MNFFKQQVNLRLQNDWIVRYSDDQNLPHDEWTAIPSDGSPLTRIVVPDMQPGRYYYVTVESNGIVSPVLVVMTPSENTSDTVKSRKHFRTAQ